MSSWLRNATIGAVGQLDADIVGSRLLAEVALEIDEPDSVVADPGNHLGSVVGASITDDDHLPVLERLAPHALDDTRQDLAPVVGGRDDGHLGQRVFAIRS